VRDQVSNPYKATDMARLSCRYSGRPPDMEDCLNNNNDDDDDNNNNSKQSQTCDKG